MFIILGLVQLLLTKYDGLADPSRVYIAGHSNGCAMAQRLGYEASDLFAAVGCHSFFLLVENNATTTYQSIPVIEVHGIQDFTVYYDDSFNITGIGAVENFERWGALNSCKNESSRRNFDKYYTDTFHDCDAPVRLVSIPAAGHYPFPG